MNLDELESKFKELEKKITELDDIKQIEILQKTYGYYVDNHMYDDLIDLFCDDCTFELCDIGVYLGKKGVKNFFKGILVSPKEVKKRLYLHMQLQGVVHLDPGGNTACGRWQLLSLQNAELSEAPGVQHALWITGVYEVKYIKEDGIWKIKNSVFNPYFVTTHEDGWVKQPFVPITYASTTPPDIPSTNSDTLYTSGYVLPCHFINPVTGK